MPQKPCHSKQLGRRRFVLTATLRGERERVVQGPFHVVMNMLTQLRTLRAGFVKDGHGDKAFTDFRVEPLP